MNDTTHTATQLPTYDDMRRLLHLANALHATPAAGRADQLASSLLAILDAVNVGVYVTADSGAALTALAFASTRPVPPRADQPAPPGDLTGPVHEVLSVPPHGVDPAGIVSIYRAGSRVSALAAWRPEAFEARHTLLLRLLHPEAAWIFDQAFIHVSLPRGTEAVLELMLAGLPEKEIARRVRRSVHTVHSHIKRVYRHYAVSSRPELLARVYGQGGDVR